MNDLISRELAVNMFKPWLEVEGYTERERNVIGAVVYGLKHLPSAQPERKRGEWVNNIHDIPICNQCGYMTPYDRAIDDYEYGNFCPNCGAQMVDKSC